MSDDEDDMYQALPLPTLVLGKKSIISLVLLDMSDMIADAIECCHSAGGNIPDGVYGTAFSAFVERITGLFAHGTYTGEYLCANNILAVAPCTEMLAGYSADGHQCTGVGIAAIAAWACSDIGWEHFMHALDDVLGMTSIDAMALFDYDGTTITTDDAPTVDELCSHKQHRAMQRIVELCMFISCADYYEEEEEEEYYSGSDTHGAGGCSQTRIEHPVVFF